MALAPTPLTRDQLNRTVLARQMLLQRSQLPLHRVVERMAGIQAQYAPSAYISMWSRTTGFERGDLTAALIRRSLVQATLMRGTIHIVSKADYAPLAVATLGSRRRTWERAWGRDADMKLIAEKAAAVRALLMSGPMKRNQIFEQLDIDSSMWNAIVNWVELVRVPPSGTWESRRADLYGLADEWVSSAQPETLAAQAHLLRRYLGAFGPASRRDIQLFTMLTMDEIDSAMATLETRDLVDPEGQFLVDIKTGTITDGSARAPVRFIGHWDAILLAHARRSGVLPEQHRSRIFHTRAPHSFATFLVDGAVRGTWSFEGGRVELDRFEPIPRRFKRDLDEEMDRLALFLRD